MDTYPWWTLETVDGQIPACNGSSGVIVLPFTLICASPPSLSLLSATRAFPQCNSFSDWSLSWSVKWRKDIVCDTLTDFLDFVFVSLPLFLPSHSRPLLVLFSLCMCQYLSLPLSFTSMPFPWRALAPFWEVSLTEAVLKWVFLKVCRLRLTAYTYQPNSLIFWLSRGFWVKDASLLPSNSNSGLHPITQSQPVTNIQSHKQGHIWPRWSKCFPAGFSTVSVQLWVSYASFFRLRKRKYTSLHVKFWTLFRFNGAKLWL